MEDTSRTEISEPNPEEINREDFMTRLTEPDRSNITRLISTFRKTMGERQQKGGVMAVGGIIEKPPPRKDIDLRVVVETGRTREDHNSQYELAMDKFRALQDIASQIILEDQGMRITDVDEPTIDEEFQSSAILKCEGTIKIEKDGTTPIELLNSLASTFEEEAKRQVRPFVILAKAA